MLSFSNNPLDGVGPYASNGPINIRGSVKTENHFYLFFNYRYTSFTDLPNKMHYEYYITIIL